MRNALFIVGLLALVISMSCKKNKAGTNCLLNDPTIRQIVNAQATIKLMGANESVYIVEDGTIDSKLIPCNLPTDFYENDLRVTISGDVKDRVEPGPGPCCSDNFVITKITR